MRPTTRIRVAGYVIRTTGSGAQLLVFDHIDFPDAGTQVPAGGVQPGEELHDAVLREVAEETGLTGVTVVHKIGSEDKPHPETGQPRRTTYFHLQAPDHIPDAWQHTVTGAGLDRELQFTCRFVPLPLPAHLADHQDALLGSIDRRWTTRTEPPPASSRATELMPPMT
ncbi:NUDIX domain-containing protein [Solwaraspora sp. WMMD791]|uniref:NUDIX hydrolase n=1 Tax=Solwaraspora sp. WMMD791 TaxID=3016086 RepID=UPI00249A33BF|nr:NUDIX domain-containing protein [Solwaraspora sp. WMMD791]WFE27885.1 NUDIX domain-containing protein [Solwaraspora sp. WMMD791]